jgi:drug/metabolite transporter (DMT)-like permease
MGGALFIGETLSWRMIMSAVIVLAGIALVIRTTPDQTHAPSTLK